MIYFISPSVEPRTMGGPRRLGSTDTIRSHERTLFFVCFVCFVVPTLGRPQAPRMSSLHLPEAARDHLAPACNRSTSQRLWNHETHEIHENPGPQAQGKGCRIGRFVCGRSKVNALGRVPSPGGNVAEPSRLWLGHDPRQDAAATLPLRRSEVRHPCRRVRARGLQHGPSLGLHLRV